MIECHVEQIHVTNINWLSGVGRQIGLIKHSYVTVQVDESTDKIELWSHETNICTDIQN